MAVIHLSMSTAQASILPLAISSSWEEDVGKVKHNCVSSAYKWKLMLCFLTISLRGEVYSRKGMGPKKGSWGTTQEKVRDADAPLCTLTRKDLSERFEPLKSYAINAIPSGESI